MANFILELWQSIFTPGPTPTLLVATNATFAALQLVLALLLYATFSIHFFVLSVLCAGLWGAINWFARELQVHQRQEEEKKRRALAAQTPAAASSSDDESETEVEAKATETARSSTASLRRSAPSPESMPAPPASTAVKQPAAGVSSVVEPTEATGELKMRNVDEEPSQSQGVRSNASTEDEWEKVSENEKDK
ncbi:hypothetical protein VTJ49DRAFT_7318 [Mycothermus thermophilus]|uniref:Pkr1-domain-containing protein n=1 Tax=Humicola insolens TaxID=85995 RepID=A0ABR3VHA5_HUMIN